MLVTVVAADNLFRPDRTGAARAGRRASGGRWRVAVLNWVVNRWLDDRRDDFFAALAERGHPELHDGLINALQLGRVDRPGYSPQLVRRIVDDAAAATAGVDFSDSLDTRPAKRAAAVAGAAVAADGRVRLAFAPRFFNGLARVLLPVAEVAPYTATQRPRRLDPARKRAGARRLDGRRQGPRRAASSPPRPNCSGGRAAAPGGRSR